MKVLLLPSSYPSDYSPNSAPFFRDHAKALQKSDLQVIVLAVVPVSIKVIVKQGLRFLGGNVYNDDGIITYMYSFISIPKCRWLDNTIRKFIGLCLFRDIERSNGMPDIQHVHGFLAGDIARCIKHYYRIPYVITEHSTSFHYGTLSFTQKRLASRVFRDSAECTAVSDNFAQLLSSKYNRQFIYTPNPTDIPETAPEVEGNAPSAHDIRICNVAFMHLKKNQSRLIRVFSRLLKEYPNAELHFVGDGPERPLLMALCESLGISSKVIFHGAVAKDNVFRIMRSCNIFALSSDYETFGVVLIEALACGLPVVATKCGGPESIIVNSALGYLAEKDDDDFYNGFLSTIHTIFEEPDNSDKRKRFISENFSLEAVGKRFKAIYVAIMDVNTSE